MLSWLTTLATFAACLALCSSTANFTCNKNGTHMTMVLQEIKGTFFQYATLDEANSVVGCASTDTIDIDGTTYMTIEVVTDISTNVPVDATCKVSAVSSNTNVTYYIIRYGASALDPSDLKYYFYCDSALATGLTQEVADTNIDFVGSSLANQSLTVSSQNIEFAILDTSDVVQTGNLDFASMYKFRITLTREGVPGVPLYLQITGLKASGTATYTDSIDMLTNQGCGIPGSTVFVINNPLSIATAPTLATTSVVGVTGTFTMGLFTSKKVWFMLYYDLSCYSTTDDRCLNPATYCANPPSTRKRRSTDESARNGTLELAVNVDFGDSFVSGLGGNKGTQETISEKECKMMNNFWVVAIVLGVLLLIVLVFAVSLFFRLRREQRTKLVNEDRVGVRNLAF